MEIKEDCFAYKNKKECKALNEMYTIKKFIELTENDYGGEIIKKLKEYYK